MGLIKNLVGSATDTAKNLAGDAGYGAIGGFGGTVSSVMFKEYFTSGDMSNGILMKRAEQVLPNGTYNKRTDSNIITNGSVIDIQENQCMIIVENGKIVELCTIPGQYTYNTDLAPSFYGAEPFKDKLKDVVAEFVTQATAGGQRMTTQRVYFINMGRIMEPIYWGAGNISFKHSTMIPGNPVPLQRNITLKAHGQISTKIGDPASFYKELGSQFAGGNNGAYISVSSLDKTLFSTAKSNITAAVSASIKEIGKSGIVEYNELTNFENQAIITEGVNKRLAATSLGACGFVFYDFSITDDIIVPEDDLDAIAAMQEATFMGSNLNAANYAIQNKMAEGFQAAGSNPNGGVNTMVGMGMAMGGMGTMGNISQQPVQQYPQYQQPQYGYVAQQPMQQPAGGVVPPASQTAGWICSNCGTENTGKFCHNCGTKKAEVPKTLKCDKCGWTAPIGSTPTKFCPECGDKVTEEDFI